MTSGSDFGTRRGLHASGSVTDPARRVQQLQRQLDDQRAEFAEALNAERADTEQQMRRLTDELGMHRRRADDATLRAESTTAGWNDLQHRAVAAETAATEARRRAEDLTARLDGQRDEFAEALEAERTSAAGQLEALRTEFAETVQAERDDRERELTAAGERATAAEQRADAARQQADTAAQELLAARGRVDELDATARAADERHRSLEHQFVVLQQTHADERATADAILADVQRELADTREQLATREQYLAQMERAMADAEQRGQALAADADRRLAENERRAEADRAQQDGHRAELERRLAEAEQRAAEADHRADEAEQRAARPRPRPRPAAD